MEHMGLEWMLELDVQILPGESKNAPEDLQGRMSL